MNYKVKEKSKAKKQKKGFVSLIALLLANVFLLIGLSVFGIAIKELNLSYGGKESLFAFYAADGGVECALYWDIKKDAFNPSLPRANIECNEQNIPVNFTDLGGGAGKCEFELNFAPNPSAPEADFYPCAQIVITKEADGNTIIKSYGQNTGRSNLRRVERAWKVSYVSAVVCSANGESCSGDGDCCSGNCKGGFCCRVVGGSLIPQTGWTLSYVDSEELVGDDGAAINAFDGDIGTIWHTEWFTSNPTHPHEIQIDIGDYYGITGFRYLPRQDGSDNGRIKDYEFYASVDGSNWNLASTGAFADDATEQEIIFAEEAAKYIKLKSLSAYDSDPWTSVAEINLLSE